MREGAAPSPAELNRAGENISKTAMGVKFIPKRKKGKTAVHAIFELLHRVEASAKVGLVFYLQYLKLKGCN